HQQHELGAEHGRGRRGGKEAHTAAMALDVSGECLRIAQDARGGRHHQPGKKQRIEPEQDRGEHGDAMQLGGGRDDAGGHDQGKIGRMHRLEVVGRAVFETKPHDRRSPWALVGAWRPWSGFSYWTSGVGAASRSAPRTSAWPARKDTYCRRARSSTFALSRSAMRFHTTANARISP